MQKRKKKKNPLTKAQNELLRQSLRRLLGDGLIKEEQEKEAAAARKMILRNALDSIILD